MWDVIFLLLVIAIIVVGYILSNKYHNNPTIHSLHELLVTYHSEVRQLQKEVDELTIEHEEFEMETNLIIQKLISEKEEIKRLL